MACVGIFTFHAQFKFHIQPTSRLEKKPSELLHLFRSGIYYSSVNSSLALGNDPLTVLENKAGIPDRHRLIWHLDTRCCNCHCFVNETLMNL